MVTSGSLQQRRASSPWLGDRPPHLPCGRGELPAAVMFPGDPGRVERFAEVLEDFKIVGQNREFRIGVGRFDGVELGVCSTGIGGPSTEIAIVEAAGLGARFALRVGGAGALRPEIPLGALLVVREALRGSGAAGVYAPAGIRALADPEMLAALQEAADEQRAESRVVTVATTDSYYLGQGRPLANVAPNAAASIEAYRERGADALEMETETVLVVGAAMGLKAGALLAVHANRATECWLEDFGPAQDRMLRVACSALARLVRGEDGAAVPAG